MSEFISFALFRSVCSNQVRFFRGFLVSPHRVHCYVFLTLLDFPVHIFESASGCKLRLTPISLFCLSCSLPKSPMRPHFFSNYIGVSFYYRLFAFDYLQSINISLYLLFLFLIFLCAFNIFKFIF